MSKSPPLPPWLKHLALLLALSTLYVITARLGLTLALPPGDKATAVWPPSGIALAALLLLGYRLWPGIWLGAFLANFWDFFTPDNDFSLTTHLLASGGIAVGSTLQPLLGAYLLRRCLGQQSPLEGAGSVFWFLGVGLLMYLVAATVGVTTLYLAGFTSLAVYPLNWWTWWLGDVLGVLMVTPLALAWWRKGPERAWGSRRIAEAGVLLGVLLMVEWWVFGGWELWGIDSRFLVYLTVPPLVWAAFRFGARGATLELLLVTGIAVWGTAQGHGPFAGETLNESLLLQTFMGVLTVMTLILVGVLTERQRTERESQRAREGLTDFIENAAVGLHWVGPDGAILWANQTELDLLGYRQEEYIGRHISEFHADQEVIDDILGRLANHETIHDYEARLRCKDGSIKHVLIDSNVFWQEGQFVHTRCFTWDITRRKEAEESARRLAEEMALVDQVARIITSTLDTSEVYERFAAGLKELIPFDRVMINTIDSTGEAFKYQQIAGLVYPGRRTGDTIPLEGSLTKQFMISGQPLVWSDVITGPRSRGDEVLLKMGMRSALLTPLTSKGRVIGTLSLSSQQAGTYGPREQAILERLANLIAPAVENAQLYEETRAEKERAAAALDQLKTVMEGLEAGKEALRREMLLKEEIHHRVKNNLQVISSLLYLQSINVTEQATLDVLRESRSRVKSIALVHEKLHMSEDSEKLDFTEYTTDLLADLFGAYGAYQRGVTVNAQIKDIFLGIDTAIPCGLIINELASNALKHAFPDGMKGEVWIELYPLRDRTYTLVVRDNGVGLPLGFSLENTKSLGLKLVRDLTQQLDGKMEIETGNGSLFHITFKGLLYKERW